MRKHPFSRRKAGSLPLPALKRILVVNDDGIHASGIACLERCARRLADSVCVVAPDRERSGASRSLTLGAPLRLRRLHYESRFAVDGSPADCVIVALHDVMRDAPPDLVLSGVNHGANIADDIALSGTVGAAMEARAHGVPAVAVSQALDAEGSDDRAAWDRIEDRLPALIDKLRPLFDAQPAMIFNINFPSSRAVARKNGANAVRVAVPAAPRLRTSIEKRIDPRRESYVWTMLGSRDERSLETVNDADSPLTDLEALRQGCTAISPLTLNPHRDGKAGDDAVKRLRAVLAPAAPEEFAVASIAPADASEDASENEPEAAAPFQRPAPF